MAESITKTGLKKLITLRNFLIYKRYHLLAQFHQKKFTLNPQAHFVTSIASYPKRSHLLPAVFEALSRQTVKPRKMIMVLSEEEWPGLVVPSYIKKLIDRGVEIIWAKNNTYAVKKLVPVIEKYPDLAVITLDDDIIYHPSLIYSLIENKYTAERCIVGHVGKILVRKGNSLNMMYRVNKNASISTPPRTSLSHWVGRDLLSSKIIGLQSAQS